MEFKSGLGIGFSGSFEWKVLPHNNRLLLRSFRILGLNLSSVKGGGDVRVKLISFSQIRAHRETHLAKYNNKRGTALVGGGGGRGGGGVLTVRYNFNSF